jgi:hypothetical protein
MELDSAEGTQAGSGHVLNKVHVSIDGLNWILRKERKLAASGKLALISMHRRIDG